MVMDKFELYHDLLEVRGHVKRSFCIEIIDDHTSDLGVQAILSNCMKERNF